MKKAVSLILALVMCLSLCACGNKGKSSEPSAETTAVTDPLAFLYGHWVRNDDWDWKGGLDLYENGIGRGLAGEDITWTFGDGILTITDEMSSSSFKYLNSNGFNYLVCEEYTFVKTEDSDAVPTTAAIELTVDNWKDYFEIQVNTIEEKDQFGELTGEVQTEIILKVKDSNRLLCGYGTDPILMRFSASGKTVDASTDSGGLYLNGYFDEASLENLSVDQIEMVKIEGTITYLDNI